MDSFFSFLETQAGAELENRRQIALAEVQADATTAGAGVVYREGQPVQVSLPSWVVPVAIVAGGLLLLSMVNK